MNFNTILTKYGNDSVVGWTKGVINFKFVAK